ncbi:hypothetical protein GCM10010398_20200 [Streptomyces fimbriatus]
MALQIVHRALDAGIGFVATTDVYSAGVPEEIVGKALLARPATGACHRATIASVRPVAVSCPPSRVSRNLGSAGGGRGAGRCHLVAPCAKPL